MWKCLNNVIESDKIIFRAGNVYEEGDDRGDIVNPDDIAICLFNDTGNRSYLFGKQVFDNFVEIELTDEEEKIVEIIRKAIPIAGKESTDKAITFFVELCKQDIFC